MVWVQVALFVASLVISYALAPKPKTQEMNPANMDEFDIPVATESAPIPVLFGTRWINQPNVVWYGDLRVFDIKKSSGK
jgi:hypothetical protein